MNPTREELARFTIKARVWVAGRAFNYRTEYGTGLPWHYNTADRYVVIKPMADLPPAFLDPSEGYAADWTPPGPYAKYGHFVFQKFPCPALTVENVWSGPDGGWAEFSPSEMVFDRIRDKVRRDRVAGGTLSGVTFERTPMAAEFHPSPSVLFDTLVTSDCPGVTKQFQYREPDHTGPRTELS